MTAHPITPWLVGCRTILTLDGMGSASAAVIMGEWHDHRRFTADLADREIVMTTRESLARRSSRIPGRYGLLNLADKIIYLGPLGESQTTD